MSQTRTGKIPPGTVLSGLVLHLPTGRWATMRMPGDLNAEEIKALRHALGDFVEYGLGPCLRSAEAIERDAPGSGARDPWEEPNT